MNMPKNMNSILFNLAGVAVMLTAGGYMVMSYLLTPKVEVCSTRYAPGQQFVFDGIKGQPLTPIDLQARSGSREWGVLKNAKILKADGAAAASILEVSLAATGDEDKVDQNGVGFVWPVSELSKANSACLSYSVHIPAKFEFMEPGYFPGLFGATDVTQIDEVKPDAAFAARMGWVTGGDLAVELRIPAEQGYWQASSQKTVWPSDRWVSVEQEVKLNAPGTADGILRVWIDGKLAIDQSGFTFRRSTEAGFSGVVSDIGYAHTASTVAAIRVSPFTLQWQ